MDFVFWIILIVLIVGVVWWLLNRSSSANTRGRAEGMRADGALEGGSAAASAEAAATTGIAGAAGFGRPAEPTPPTTADESADLSVAPAGRDAEPAPQTAAAGPAAAPSVGSSATANADTDNADTGQGGRAMDSGPEPEVDAEVGGPGQRPDAMSAEDALSQENARRQAERRQEEDAAEWETQWSEASGSTAATRTETLPGDLSTGRDNEPPASAPPVHHPEYTGPHSPTLPGAETASVEDADDGAEPVHGDRAEERPGDDAAAAGHTAPPDVPDNAAATETLDRTQSSAAVETSASHTAEPPEGGAEPENAGPSGHLDAEHPYGEGSASPAPDGSGPVDYTVKGDAASMTYYEEGHPDYEQTRAGVWFESAAHAEAAGFRAPRRKRL